MIEGYSFGDRVLVERLVERCRGGVSRPYGPDRHATIEIRPQRTRRDGGFYRPPGRYYERDWPGLPVPAPNGYLLEPDASSPLGIYVRLRRLDLHPWGPGTGPFPGIVVGQTWRCEGRVVPTRTSYGHEDGWDREEGRMEDQRRVPLYQVALELATGRARVVFVYPDDLKGA